MKKAFRFILFTVLFSLTVLCTCSFAQSGAVSVSTVEITQGQTTVDIDINISDNPGIIYAKFMVSFPDEFRLTGVKDGGILGNSTHSNNLSSPYTLYWNNGTATSDFTANGTVATLTFTVPESIPAGTYPITVSVNQGNTFNYYGDDALFTTVAGGITVNAPVIKNDPVTLSEISILDSSYNVLESIPSTSFVAEVSVENISHEGTLTVMLAYYDENGQMLGVRYMYTNPIIGQVSTLGASITNTDGKVAKVKAMVFDSLASFSPLTESVEINK